MTKKQKLAGEAASLDIHLCARRVHRLGFIVERLVIHAFLDSNMELGAISWTTIRDLPPSAEVKAEKEGVNHTRRS